MADEAELPELSKASDAVQLLQIRSNDWQKGLNAPSVGRGASNGIGPQAQQILSNLWFNAGTAAHASGIKKTGNRKKD